MEIDFIDKEDAMAFCEKNGKFVSFTFISRGRGGRGEKNENNDSGSSQCLSCWFFGHLEGTVGVESHPSGYVAGV